MNEWIMQIELEETLRIYKVQTIDYIDEETVSKWGQTAHTKHTENSEPRENWDAH